VARHAREVGVLAVVTGALTGLGVAAFDRVVAGHVFEAVMRAPLWVQCLGPALGLTFAALALRWLARGASSSTADEYINAFHAPDAAFDERPVPGRLVASAATLGGGAAMGFEGPSIYIGAAVGSWLQSRFRRLFAQTDPHVLLVCGAAAGVAAIFKAPATGLVFALEVPYRQDLARRMLLPAMFASAASYVVYVAVNGTAPLFPSGGAPPFDLRDLGGAALIGLLCGGAARLFAVVLRSAKRTAGWLPALVRVPIAGAAIAGVVVAGRLITGQPLMLGSGYQAIAWALQPGHAVTVILAVFLLRAVATALAVGGGGAGGLFVPLVVQGAVLGSAVSAAIGAPDSSLFPLLGVAAFLGAGYRVPLAAVVFVAETTGRPGFVVPGLIAAAASQLLMGNSSVTPYQQDTRKGPLERHLTLPVTAALTPDVTPVHGDTLITDVVARHLDELARNPLPVVSGEHFVGMIVLDDITRLPHRSWPTTTASTLARQWATCPPDATLRDAVATMEERDIATVAVVDGHRLIGVTSNRAILRLDTMLDPTDAGGSPPAPPHPAVAK
jgi:CIC family chloride channel protein